MKITKIDLLFCALVEDGWRPLREAMWKLCSRMAVKELLPGLKCSAGYT